LLARRQNNRARLRDAFASARVVFPFLPVYYRIAYLVTLASFFGRRALFSSQSHMPPELHNKHFLRFFLLSMGKRGQMERNLCDDGFVFLPPANRLS